MLTKQVDPQRYNSIEAEIKSVRWTEEQHVQDLKEFIKLVLDRLEGVVPVAGGKSGDTLLISPFHWGAGD
jgi:hypothetical protein